VPAFVSCGCKFVVYFSVLEGMGSLCSTMCTSNWRHAISQLGILVPPFICGHVCIHCDLAHCVGCLLCICILARLLVACSDIEWQVERALWQCCCSLHLRLRPAADRICRELSLLSSFAPLQGRQPGVLQADAVDVGTVV
jgi:hypothetical protein